MSKKMKRIFAAVLSLAIICSLAACGGGASSSSAAPATETATPSGRTEKLVISVGSLGSGREGDPLAPAIEKMAAVVEEKTNGMITFEYYYGGQLGSEQDMLDQILTGSLDMAPLSGTVLASIWPEMYVYTLPFAFASFDDFWAICGTDGVNDGAVQNVMAQIVNESGKAHDVSVFSGNFRGCFDTKHAIRTVEDFKGLTFRIQAGEIFTDIYDSLGASTAAIPFSELFTSMQQGVVDGADLGIGFYYDNKFPEVAKFNTELNHCLCPNVMLMSNKLYDQLSDEELAIFQEALLEAEKTSLQVCKDAYETYYPKSAEDGVEVIRFADLTDEAVAGFREATAPVWDKYKDVVGEDVFNTMQDARRVLYGDAID